MKSIIICYISLVFFSCGSTGPESLQQNTYYRDEMRTFVQEISQYAKSINPEFLVVPQNGQELFTVDGEPDGLLSSAYLEAIDGTGREDLFYGYSGDDIPTPPSENSWMTAFLDRGENAGVEALVTDYCSTQSYVDDSYFQNETRGYISFAADHRELDNIPAYPVTPYNQNIEDISQLQDARNFLYLINPVQFSDVQAFMNELQSTNFDILIIDLFFDDIQLSTSNITSIKLKASGGERLILAYMSIGEAENYRYYWQEEWNTNPPLWLLGENPEWPGNYLVEYWNEEWKSIIYGNPDAYLDRILNAGFDGVYLDKIDAFEEFE